MSGKSGSPGTLQGDEFKLQAAILWVLVLCNSVDDIDVRSDLQIKLSAVDGPIDDTTPAKGGQPAL